MVRWVRWMLLCWCAFFAVSEGRAADALPPRLPTEDVRPDPASSSRPRDLLRGARYHETRPTRFSPLTPRLRLDLRVGRYVTETGWGLFGAATIVMPLSLALQTYAFEGPWYNKADYDRGYLVRADIAQGMLLATPVIAGTGLLLTMIGPIVEGRALHRMKGVPAWPGYLGLGLFLAGGAVFAVELATFTSPIAGPNLMLSGWTFAMAQYAVNSISVRRMSLPTREAIFPERQRVQIGLGPAPVRGPGLAVVGRF